MTILPVVARELRVASRRRTTYWARFAAAFAAILVSAWIWFVTQEAPPATVAQTLFVSISGLVFGFCLLAGTRNTADCISEEKREGTLGLLFLTDLKGFDVVFGKLTANSITSFYAALAVFPLLGIPLLMGSIPPMAFVQMIAVLANTLFFSLAAGVLISSVSRDSRRAAAGTFLLIALVTVGGLIAGAWLQALFLSSPGYAIAQVMNQVMDQAQRLGPAAVAKSSLQCWRSIATTHAIAWIFLALACWIVPRRWQDRPSRTTTAHWRERLQAWKFGTATERHSLRRRLLEINPFLWLAGRDRFKAYLVWLLLLGFVGAWLWWYGRDRDIAGSSESGGLIAFLLHCALKFWLASEACRYLAEHRRSGALELLLSTPLSVAEILRGNMLALQRQFGGPIIAVLMVDLLLLGLSREFNQEMILLFAAGMGGLVLDCFALAWLGMWYGLSAKNFNRASGAALARILALPWVIFFVALATFFSLPQFSRLNWTLKHGLALWCAITAGLDLYFIVWSKHKLLAEFRHLATQPNVEGSFRDWWRFKRKVNVAAQARQP